LFLLPLDTFSSSRYTATTEGTVARFVLCALVFAFLAALASAAPVPRQAPRPPAFYFPTKIGATLVYVESGTEWAMVVTDVAERGRTKLVTVGRIGRDERVTPLFVMSVTADGLARVERTGQALDVPETWLRLPAKTGDGWDYVTGEPDIHPRPVVSHTLVGTEDVTVPAGTFRCVRVETRQAGRVVNYWFAPDVGLVKTEAATWVEVLKSYTPGKD
jgi:hypothetical protein